MGLPPFNALYTIGHSNRSGDEFFACLMAHRINVLVDIRARPTSRRSPQFDADNLRSECEAAGIIYHLAGRHLGGLRRPNDNSLHLALTEDDLRGFADYMDTPEFERAAAQLVKMGASSLLAMVCAERDPLYCHRGLIADYLLLKGVEVMHIIDETEVRAHQLHPSARRESSALIYDRNYSSEPET